MIRTAMNRPKCSLRTLMLEMDESTDYETHFYILLRLENLAQKKKRTINTRSTIFDFDSHCVYCSFCFRGKFDVFGTKIEDFFWNEKRLRSAIFPLQRQTKTRGITQAG